MGGRRTVFSRRTGSLWPSAGAAMRGMAREYAAGNARGPGWREFAGTLGQLQAGRQAGSGMARSRARARLNWDSQGQRCGRCRVRRRAERVIRPTRAKTPPPEGLGGYGPFAQTNPRRPAGEVMGHHLDRQPGAVGGENAPTEDGSAPRRTSGPGWRSRSRRGGDDQPPVRASPRPGR